MSLEEKAKTKKENTKPENEIEYNGIIYVGYTEKDIERVKEEQWRYRTTMLMRDHPLFDDPSWDGCR